jgi:hypothetical protein
MQPAPLTPRHWISTVPPPPPAPPTLHLQVYIWAGLDEPSRSTVQSRHDPKYFSVGPGLGRGRDPWAGTNTARLRQARNDLDARKGPYIY